MGAGLTKYRSIGGAVGIGRIGRRVNFGWAAGIPMGATIFNWNNEVSAIHSRPERKNVSLARNRTRTRTRTRTTLCNDGHTVGIFTVLPIFSVLSILSVLSVLSILSVLSVLSILSALAVFSVLSVFSVLPINSGCSGCSRLAILTWSACFYPSLAFWDQTITVKILPGGPTGPGSPFCAFFPFPPGRPFWPGVPGGPGSPGVPDLPFAPSLPLCPDLPEIPAKTLVNEGLSYLHLDFAIEQTWRPSWTSWSVFAIVSVCSGYTRISIFALERISYWKTDEEISCFFHGNLVPSGTYLVAR